MALPTQASVIDGLRRQKTSTMRRCRPLGLLPSFQATPYGGRSATGMTSDPLVEAAYKMTALGSTAACVHRRLSSSSQAFFCQCCLDALCGGGFSLRRRCLVHLHRRKEQKGGRRLNSRRPLFPFFLSRHHREQPMFISSPRVHVLFLFLFFSHRVYKCIKITTCT